MPRRTTNLSPDAMAAAIVESCIDATIGTDLDGHILYWNAAAAEIFGEAQETAIGKHVSFIVPDGRRDESLEALKQAANGKHTELTELTWPTPSGEGFAGSLCFCPVTEGDQIVGAAVIIRDDARSTRRREDLEQLVSERTAQLEAQRRAAINLVRDAEGSRQQAIEAAEALRQSEIQLRQAQKMEAVGRLAGGVAHDFNNLLTAIFSFSHFVLETLSEADPAHADMLEVINAAERGKGLTGQLLAFSRKSTIVPRSIELDQKVEETRRMLTRILGEDIELTTRLNAGGSTILVDPGALEHVIVNLAVNAGDAMPSGGRLVIETEVCQVSEDQATPSSPITPGEYAKTSIIDNGTGMDEETAQHIFEPFFTTKETGRGTGLGLSSAYGIITQAGGHILVESKKGEGSTFQVLLPTIDGPAAATETAPVVSAPMGGKEMILLVEDDDQVRRLCERAVKRFGYAVVAVSGPEEALRFCATEQRPVDLLLTDVVMPRMSGKELALRLAESRPEMKVLFMSGYTPDAIVHHGVIEEGVMLIHKPFTPNKLAPMIREVLSGDGHNVGALIRAAGPVLLVDDDAEFLLAAKMLLQDDYQVLLAANGESALAIIKKSPPAAVICDFRLPGMDGQELYEAVLKIDPELGERFVFITGLTGEDLLGFVRAANRRIIHKPLQREELHDAVKMVLGRRSVP